MTNFGAAAFKCYFTSLGRILELSVQDGMSFPSSLVLQILAAQQHAMNGTSGEALFVHLSTLCRVESALLKHFSSNSHFLVGNIFAEHASQRVKGAVAAGGWEPTSGEYRANGQWETLIAETLRGSSLKVITSYMFPGEQDVNKEMKSAVLAANHWQRVLCSVVNAMVPTAALLRFGVSYVWLIKSSAFCLQSHKSCPSYHRSMTEKVVVHIPCVKTLSREVPFHPMAIAKGSHGSLPKMRLVLH